MPEIEVRPALESDIATLAYLDHSYTSEYVWQMDLSGGELQAESENDMHVSFRQVRYPRALRIEYPRPSQYLVSDWQERSGLLVAVLPPPFNQAPPAEANARPPGEPIGYISLSLERAPATTWITDILVRRRLRRQGIGSALTLAALEWAAEHESRSIVMDLQTKNHPALRLAQKMGFNFSGYMDHFYPNGDIALFFAKAIW